MMAFRFNFFRPWTRRRWRWPFIAAAILGAAIACWLLTHLRPRHDHFSTRRGAIVESKTETQREGNFISEAVRITAASGLIVELRVLRPAAAQRPLPLVVLLGGHRTGRNAVDVLGDPGAIAVAALDYPYHGPERPRGLSQSLRSVPAIQQGLLDTPPAVSVALDWLSAQPWVDSSRVELMGVSLGVPFAAAAGALDKRFRRVWLIHGGVGNRAWIANRLEGRIESSALRHVAAGLVHLLAHGASFETAEWVSQIAPRPVVIVGASEDEQLPRASIEGLYAAAGNPKELLWSAGGHVRPKHVEIIRQLLGMVRSRIETNAGAGTPAGLK